MNLAKVSTNGQVTVPVEIRKKLNLKEGDKILFFERAGGEIVINNASATAIVNAQKAFEGADKDFWHQGSARHQKIYPFFISFVNMFIQSLREYINLYKKTVLFSSTIL
jgi:antitoxin PrlF